jgi:hypothetical protein
MNKVCIAQIAICIAAALSVGACGSDVSQNMINTVDLDASIGIGGAYSNNAGNKAIAPMDGSTMVSQGGSSGEIGGSGGARVANGRAGEKAGSVAGTSGTNKATGGAGGNSAGRPPAVIDDNDLVAAPDGRESAKGTLAEPTTLTAAITKIAASGTIYVRGGSYKYSDTITIQPSNSGSAGKLKTIRAYNDENPVLDFSGESRGGLSGGPRGVQLNGSYWHIQWITIEKAGDNGMHMAGSNNIIEGCVFRGNGDTGLQISASGSGDWPSNNLILNCESYDNDDATGENADGFAAKLTAGTGNVFRGCVSHHNADDGWDLFTQFGGGAIGPVTIDQCIAHHNGTLTDGTVRSAGDRNGFKLGGSGISVDHIVTRSIAYANGAVGFTWNNNPGEIKLTNNLSFDNAGGNYVFGSSSQAVFTNNVSFWTSGGVKNDSVSGSDVSQSNCWWKSSKSACGKGLTVAAEDFANPLGSPSINRNPDGSLDFTPFTLSPNSDLINAGVIPSGDLPFAATDYHGAPDLGAVEQ